MIMGLVVLLRCDLVIKVFKSDHLCSMAVANPRCQLPYDYDQIANDHIVQYAGSA